MEVPQVPPGWDTATVPLLRLVAPDGAAAAWVAPAHGGNCVAYVVRRGDVWVPVIDSGNAQTLLDRPTRYGCPVLFPFPGHVLDAQYAWGGRTFRLPRNTPTGPHHVHGFAHTHAWRVVARDEECATLAFSTTTDLRPAERAGYPFDVRLTLELVVADGALRLDLHAVNEGDAAAPVGLGFHPYFHFGLLGGVRAEMGARLPGNRERVLRGGVPAGEVDAVAAETIAVPPEGETTLVARTGFEDGAVAWLTGPGRSPRVRLVLQQGLREVLLFAPADQATVSLEPLTTPISGGSQAPEHPDALPALAPASALRAVATLDVEDVR